MFSRQELKEIKKNLHKIENKKSLSTSKKAKNYLNKLEESECEWKVNGKFN